MSSSRYFRKSFQNSGQALVLVLLSLAVVLTLVLFVLSRSVTDITVSTREVDAVRAFSAAEAGVEQALIVGAGTVSSEIGNNARFTSTVTDFASGASTAVYPVSLASGDTSTFWFVNHNSDGTTVCSVEKPCYIGDSFRICWGKSGTSASSAVTPAIEISLFYETTPGNPATVRIARGAFDPNVARRATNAFVANDAGTCTINGEAFQFQKTFLMSSYGVPVGSYGAQNGLQFARVRMLYNTDTNHKVGINVTGAGHTLLPSQGILASSSGVAGASTRRLEVFQSWPEPPQVFDYAVYTSTGITK